MVIASFTGRLHVGQNGDFLRSRNAVFVVDFSARGGGRESILCASVTSKISGVRTNPDHAVGVFGGCCCNQ